MTKGKKSKFSGVLRNDGAALAASKLRANSVRVYERLIGLSHKKDIIGGFWKAERRPADDLHLRRLTEAQKSSWPVASMPGVGMLPGSGYFQGLSTGPKGVTLMVAAFGVSEDRLEKIVDQIRDWQETEPRYRPVFLTDCGQHTAFRHSGYNFEYFPPEIYCGDDQVSLFVERFHLLRSKWHAASFLDLGVPSFLRGRLEDVYDELLRIQPGASRVYSPRLPKPKPKPQAVTDFAALRAEYYSKGLQEKPDTFALCRIIGNDLPPRHKSGQSVRNLRFLLENEPIFEDCKKSWIVNRVVDPAQQRAITDLLDEHGQSYVVIPFELDEYRRAGWKLSGFPRPDFMLRDQFDEMTHYDQLRAQAHIRTEKILYAVNNNGARNVALDMGRDEAKWVLPWDGNCFLTQQAWDEVRSAIQETPYMKYFVVPMVRVSDNQPLIEGGEIPEPEEEPQIIFRSDSSVLFDEKLPYGRRPKVDLLWRLGVPGVWDSWADDVWDLPRSKRSEDAGAFGEAGRVARLASGQEEGEEAPLTKSVNRAIARSEGLIDLLDGLDQQALASAMQPDHLTVYALESLGALSRAPAESNMALVYDRLLQEAELALERGTYSVLDKATEPPSGDKQDYFNPAAFWWPDKRTQNGLPGEWREGHRSPGSELYSDESAQYDRTRLQRVFDDTTVLALAGCASGQKRYDTQAAKLVRRWFLNPETAMSPHLEFAQFNPNNDPENGSARGLIDTRDFYFFLDAVRLLRRSGALTKAEGAVLREWLTAYLDWLVDSEQGRKASRLGDYQGTSYDLQVAAIALYVDDAKRLADVLLRCRYRIGSQFGVHGQQLREMKKVQSANFCAMNLQTWMHLANLALSVGDDLWGYQTEDGVGLAMASNWMLSRFDGGTWPYRQDRKFHLDRMLPLTLGANARFGGTDSVGLAMKCLRKPMFHPEDVVPPFWMLSLGLREVSVSAPNNVVTRVRKEANAIANAAVEDTRQDWTPSELENRLWGGYSSLALAKLKKLANDPDARDRDRESACWKQARWFSGLGRSDDALEALEQISPERRAKRKDYALLEADCLIRAGRNEEAREIALNSLSERMGDPSLTFVVANSFFGQKGMTRRRADGERLSWINKVYSDNGLETLKLLDPKKPLSFFNIQGSQSKGAAIDPEVQPKVSVIIPVYNGEETLPVALRSLQGQTWKNLEIIVSDDASTDQTCEIVKEIARTDRRIKLLRGKNNRGAYVARNAGLRRATGAFITVHDSDDWSHPEKIELQMRHLLVRSNSAGAVTVWGRVDPDLYALSNWRPMSTLFTTNHSSLMLRREAFDQIGHWDRVRIGADMELLRRFETLFGKDKITTIFSKVPLSLSLERPEALTRAQTTHVKTIYHGVRLDYRRNYLRWRSKLSQSEAPNFTTSRKRVFPAPRIMLPIRAPRVAYRSIFVADFSANAPQIEEVVEVVNAAVRSGKGVGIMDWPDFERELDRGMHPIIEDLVDTFKIELVSAFEKAEAESVVLCDPYLTRFEIDGLSGLDVEQVTALCVDTATKGVQFDPRARRMPSTQELEQIFGAPCQWHSIKTWCP
ncbi:putative glycosyltransferase EpsE [Shimia sp. SK013]|nr:putative glycosyltransferase EpsE [Shimia sp. SK013]